MLVLVMFALCQVARLHAACGLQATADVGRFDLNVINDGADPWTDIRIALYGKDYFQDDRNAIRFGAPPSALRFATATRHFKADTAEGRWIVPPTNLMPGWP
jgi:hypothetical protein